MKKAVLRYGGYSVIFMVLFFIGEMLVFAKKKDFNVQEIFGWIGIIISTMFIFFGIRYYRDKHNNGSLSFGKGLQVGLLILLMPSLAFGIFNVIYVMLNPEFMDTYYNFQVAQLKESLPAGEAALKIQALEKDKEMFMSPAVQFFAMFFSVFAVGLVVTVISALVLRRSTERAQSQKAFS
jgi:hypothetical protein